MAKLASIGKDIADESPLQRWSRRKLASATGEVVAGQPDAVRGPEAPEPGAAETLEVESCTNAGSDESASKHQNHPPAPLPDIETLDADSDFSGFMAPEVEPDQRRAALRKLFALPQFAVRDGLDDYDHDFSKFEGLGDIVTHEMKRMAEQEARRLAQQALETDPDDSVEPESFAEAGEDSSLGQPEVEVVTSEQSGQLGQADPEPINRTA